MNLSKLASVSLSVALAACLAACAKTDAKPAADTAKIADTVKADADQLVADFNAHDATKSVSHDAPQTVGMFHGAPNVNSPAEDLDVTKKQAADTSTHVSVSGETVDVAQAGDMAVYRATYTYTQTDPKTKKPATENGNWLLIYKPQPDGSWKIAVSMIADTPAAAPAAPAGDKKLSRLSDFFKQLFDAHGPFALACARRRSISGDLRSQGGVKLPTGGNAHVQTWDEPAGAWRLRLSGTSRQRCDPAADG